MMRAGLLDSMDRKILDKIQADFPIASRPYKVIAEEIGATEEEVFRKVRRMVEDGIIRRIGANLNSCKLGYKSTLVAMKVPVERLDEVVSIVNSQDAVTHNYLRDGPFNLWFTLIAPSEEAIGKVLDEIRLKSGIKDILNLPVLKEFKIEVKFEFGEQDAYG